MIYWLIPPESCDNFEFIDTGGILESVGIKVKNKTAKHHPNKAFSRKTAVTILGSVAGIGLAAALSTCTAIPADYSAYSNVNLIPNGQFAASVATPDLGWSLDDVDGPAYNNVGYVEVVSAAGTLSSGDNWAGYGSNVLLTDLTAATGIANLPIYRLETKNLFINGDFEAGNISYNADVGTTNKNRVNSGTATVNIPSLATYFQNGSWLQMDYFSGTASMCIPLAANITGYNSEYPYTFTFAYTLSSNPFIQITQDDGSQASTSPFIINIFNASPVRYRFPYTSDSGSGNGILKLGSTGLTTLYFNSQNATIPTGITTRIFYGSMDDFQMVRSDIDNAVRYDIPWAAAGRPDLKTGGHYTVKLWVRRDMTANYSAGPPTVNNRFEADFVSISLHQNMGSTSQHGAVAVTSIGPTANAAWVSLAASSGWTNYNDIANWTQISASFAGPAMQIPGLQLAISTTNLSSSAYRSSGSVLIANPQIFWSPY